MDQPKQPQVFGLLAADTRLVQLPPEILAQILSHLPFEDKCVAEPTAIMLTSSVRGEA